MCAYIVKKGAYIVESGAHDLNYCSRERREQVPLRGMGGGGGQKARELQGMKFPGVGEEMKFIVGEYNFTFVKRLDHGSGRENVTSRHLGTGGRA